jgi:hypothetical protein
MQDYDDAIRTINQAYWAYLLEHDANALATATQLAEQLGFEPKAVPQILNEFSRQPLQEWLTRRSAAS